MDFYSADFRQTHNHSLLFFLGHIHHRIYRNRGGGVGGMYKIGLNFIYEFTAGTITKLTPLPQHYLKMVFYNESDQNQSTNLERTG